MVPDTIILLRTKESREYKSGNKVLNSCWLVFHKMLSTYFYLSSDIPDPFFSALVFKLMLCFVALGQTSKNKTASLYPNKECALTCPAIIRWAIMGIIFS